MTFPIEIIENKKRFVLTVTRTKLTGATEEYTVAAGGKEIVFRNNRPEMKRLKRVGRMHWQLVSKNWEIEEKDVQRASYFFLQVQDAIEDHLKPTPTFQQVRTKTQ